MTEHGAQVVAVLGQVPGFEGLTLPEARITRLGGLTNLVHRVEARGQSVILRIPGAGTEAYIDRAVEAHNAAAAHRAGVSPAVIWSDPGQGVLVTQALDGITTMTPDLFRSRPGSPARAGAALARLHGSGQEFRFRFELFQMIEEYLKVLADKDAVLPEGYHDVVRAAEPVRAALAAHPAPLAPCHCDPLCENFLDAGDRMWVVDWEYSGMNDPMWDLGDVAVEAGMDAAQQAEMLHAYFGGPPTPAQEGRVVMYKAMCDLLWTLWGLIQHADANPAADFWAYATERFDRCKALMAEPAFQRHLAAVAAG